MKGNKMKKYQRGTQSKKYICTAKTCEIDVKTRKVEKNIFFPFKEQENKEDDEIEQEGFWEAKKKLLPIVVN